MARSVLVAAALLVALHGPVRAATGDGVAGRVVVDGRVDEYAGDEWVADVTTPLPERRDDSQWGSDNDAARMAVTWDGDYLYVAVDCVTLDSQLLLLVDCAAAGIEDMRALGDIRRAIVFARPFTPDLVLFASPRSERPSALWFPDGAPEELELETRYVQAGLGGGALEVAIPWRRVGVPRDVRLAAAVTGGVGEGAGDVVPDPRARLSTQRSVLARLDRWVEVPVDADGDGVPDPGVSPRAVASTPDTTAPQGDEAELAVRLDSRAFAPDRGEALRFRVERDAPEAGASAFAYVTARVFSRDGELVRVLYEDRRLELDGVVDGQWDGTDRLGRVVPGGIYLVNVSWGVARGSRTGTTSAAVAVVR